jgi:Rrf2 family nitric oxide-sensitive transcriptional repressor
MQLTKHTDLSLRVMMYLAMTDAHTAPAKIKDIAQHYNVSRNHLMKVVHKLAQLGYIDSTQGRGGGISLAISAQSIIVGDIVRAMEPTLNIIDCEKVVCPLMPACLLKEALNKAANAFLESLDDYTIADLTRNKPQLLQLVNLAG